MGPKKLHHLIISERKSHYVTVQGYTSEGESRRYR